MCHSEDCTSDICQPKDKKVVVTGTGAGAAAGCCEDEAECEEDESCCQKVTRSCREEEESCDTEACCEDQDQDQLTRELEDKVAAL